MHDPNTNQAVNVTVHRIVDKSAPSLNDPNLPITVEVGKVATGGSSQISVAVTGRQGSIIGKYEPDVRLSSHYRYIGSISIPPLNPPNNDYGQLFMILRVKDNTPTQRFSRVLVDFKGLDMNTNESVRYLVASGDNYTGTGVVTDTFASTPDETAVEDILPPAGEGFDLIENQVIATSGLIRATSGGRRAERTTISPFRFSINLPYNRILAILLASVDPTSTSTGVTVFGSVELSENW